MKNMLNIKLLRPLLLRSRFAAVCALVMASVMYASSEIPANYYRAASGKQGAALKTALHNITYNHTEVSSYSALPQYFRITDVYPPGNERYGQWWDMYGNIPLYLPYFSGMNREHSFPKSWWGGSQDTPAYVDLFHLYPSEQDANMAKSNYPLGEAQSSNRKFDNGVSAVGYPMTGQGGGAPYVFEPDDEYKGDFARTYFYVVTCYENLHWSRTYMVNNNTYPTLNDWSVRLLLKWHRDDPVSQKELDRNEQVYRIQANRNPFIDYPELAEYLWGDMKGHVWMPGINEPTGDPVLITPVQDMSLDFGDTAVGGSSTSSLFLHGENLRGSLTVTVTKPRDYPNDDRRYFIPESNSVSASAVNSEGGFWLKVKYSPTEVGEHQARLVISDGGLQGSLGIALRGNCLPRPVLHSFKALPPSNIEETSYVANWEVPADDVVDYYVVTRTTFVGGKAEVSELVAETNELKIEECEPGGRETYSVHSCRLGEVSPESNVITVDLASLGMPDEDGDSQLGWAALPGGVRIVCTRVHTGVRVIDAMGRVVRLIDSIDNNAEIYLPTGVYFIVTDMQHTPMRVLVRE